MRLLDTARRFLGLDPASSGRPGPTNDWWYTDTPGGSGSSTTGEGALRVGAVYRAVNILANAYAALPLIVYRRTADGGKERATNHPLFLPLRIRPNPWQTAFEYRRNELGHVLLRGNAYSLIVSNGRGEILGLYPLNPTRMRVDQLESWYLRYSYTWEDGTKSTFPQEQIHHLRAFGTDGICGIAPVTLMRTTLSAAQNQEEYGAAQFTQAPRMAGMLKVPGKLDPEQRRELGESFRRTAAGRSGWGSVPVLHQGMEWVQVGMSNEDAQWLEGRKFSVAEIARWFGVPPHKLGDLEKSSFDNMEQSTLDFHQDSMLPWLVNKEQRTAVDLLDDGEEYFAEHLLDNVLRADSLTRAQVHEIYLRNGVRSPDEVRVAENMNKRPDGRGGIYLEQVNATRPIQSPSGAPNA